MDPHLVGATPFDGYIPGSIDSNGRMIKTIIGRHRHMIVYITDHPAVAWSYDEMPERLRPAVTEFQLLNGLRNSCLSTKMREATVALMGPALYTALLTPEGQNPKDAFIDVHAYIIRKSTDRARLCYMLFSLLSSLVLSLVPALLYLVSRYFELAKLLAVLPWIAIGITGGIIGAEISIVQRGWQLEIDPLESPLTLTAQGLLRVVLGAVFGTVLVVSARRTLRSELSQTICGLCSDCPLLLALANG